MANWWVIDTFNDLPVAMIVTDSDEQAPSLRGFAEPDRLACTTTPLPHHREMWGDEGGE